MKRVLILGSTGSIGQFTLDVIKANKDKFEVVGLATRKNVELIKQQAEEFKVPYVTIVDSEKVIKIKNVKVFLKEEGLFEIIEETKPDILVNAIVGIDGLKPLIFSIEKNIKIIALANKESMVVAGEIIKKKLKNKKVKLMPIDSEHSAIFQCLKNENIKNIKKITITASGGPLFRKKKNTTVENIVKHPIWKMGSKISVDSATMVNKGFEYVEAHYLFDLPYEKIDIVIHPQAFFHSFVHFIDGSILACLFFPDMRIPISYALGCQKERIINYAKNLNILELNKAEFYKPDFKKFPLLKLLIDCSKKENSYLVAFNAANEVLVDRFLKNEIRFEDIYRYIEKVISIHKPKKINRLEEIFDTDKNTKEEVRNLLSKTK